jgi:hypothetical protein
MASAASLGEALALAESPDRAAADQSWPNHAAPASTAAGTPERAHFGSPPGVRAQAPIRLGAGQQQSDLLPRAAWPSAQRIRHQSMHPTCTARSGARCSIRQT